MINVPDITEQKRVPERVKKKDVHNEQLEANARAKSLHHPHPR
jgi:hypothetical protein